MLPLLARAMRAGSLQGVAILSVGSRTCRERRPRVVGASLIEGQEDPRRASSLHRRFATGPVPW